MHPEKNSSSPEFIYSQSVDKQRVVITGDMATTITSMVLHVLADFNREFDYVTCGSIGAVHPATKITDAPMIIIEESSPPYAAAALCHHHIGVISEINSTAEVIHNMTHFADVTPKAGVLIFSESDPSGAIGKIPRAGVTAIPYTIADHAEENGIIILISSANKRFPLKISGQRNLQSLAASKEVLTKVGVTSDQFYQSMTTFKG